MIIARRLASVGAVAALAGAVTLATGSYTPASAAAADPSVWFSETISANRYMIEVIHNGESVGHALWFPDPGTGHPGDLLAASDTIGDTYGIEAHLSTGRIATTRGHEAPYVDQVPGDLPEDHAYQMQACLVKGTYSYCSIRYTVIS